MVTYKSRGGKAETLVESRYAVVKAGLIFLAIVGVLLGSILLFQSRNNDETEATAPADECSVIIENSVFTTGTPLTDQRILWAILNDQSEGKVVAGGIVEHIWDEGNFAFTDEAQKKMWNEATSMVKTITSPIVQPALSITASGTIVPFTPPDEAAGIEWTEVNVAAIPDMRSTFLMSSQYGDSQSTPVPTVLLSINNGTVVPSPTLGVAADHVAVNAKKVCEQ